MDTPLPEYASLQPGHGEDDVAVGNGLEHLFAEAARPTPSACETAFDEPKGEEGPEHPLDHRTQRAVRLGEALLVHAEELVEVMFHQTVERQLAGPARPVDPTADLHTSRPAGGRASGESTKGGCPSRPAPGGREEVSTVGGSEWVRRPALRTPRDRVDRSPSG
jgi:hypothetical protein